MGFLTSERGPTDGLGDRMTASSFKPVPRGGVLRDEAYVRSFSNDAYASRSRSARFRSTPHRYPDTDPSVRTTRWHGMATATGFAAHARATARTDVGLPIRFAISE